MSDGILKNWNEYKPTKTVWLWSCIGTAALTMIVGFTGGGWVTGGTATDQAATSSQQAVAQLAAGICVKRFLAADAAGTQLATLKKTDSWEQDSFIEDGGWVTFAGMKKPIDGAADLCADQLVAGKLPAATPKATGA